MVRAENGTRQKLIDTASDLLWTSSYGAVSVDDICRASNVKKGSFYHYFPSKEDLAITAMQEYYEQFIRPDMDDIFAADKPFQRQMELFANSIIEEQKDILAKYGLVCGCPLAALASEMIGPEHNGISGKACEMFDCCKKYILTSIKNASETGVIQTKDPLAKTEEIHDFVTGLMMMARIHNSLDGLERDLKPGIFRIVGLQATETPDK